VARGKSVIHLDISSNNLTQKGAKKVFKELTFNESLISLAIGSVDSVSKNKIGSGSAVRQLALYLQQSVFLQFLDLQSSQLLDSGLAILSEGLKANQTLI
jgi:hypothetical protein